MNPNPGYVKSGLLEQCPPPRREPSHHFVVAPGREIDPKKSVCLSLITLYRNDIARTRPGGQERPPDPRPQGRRQSDSEGV